MKFKLVENYDYYTEEARSVVQEYAYDAIDELKDASFDTYFTWFLKETEYEDPAKLKQAVRDFYIEAVDSGKIKQPKTMTTRALKDYLNSHKNLLNDVDELIRQCPDHLQQELKLVIDAADLNESLNEGQSRQQTYANKKFKNKILKDRVDKDNFLVHHLDDDRLERAPRSNIMIKVTDYTNSIFVPKMSVNQNIPHELITACKKLGGFDALMKELNNLNVLHVDERDNITEQSLLDYLKSI